jgi:hypothetical protein
VKPEETRINEWFVPSFGPERFRAFVGMLFLPYTGMCVAFTVVGSVAALDFHLERVGAIALIYALALGIGAHAADTMGSKKAKPWGSYFTKKQMMLLIASSLAIAYAIGVYYIVTFVPLLAIVAILEGFFLFVYNFELFGGRFHTDFWFAVSWVALPAMAGYLIQTGTFGPLPFAAAAACMGASYAEIRMSRPYKHLKRTADGASAARKLEGRLKALSLSTIVFSALVLAARLIVR